MTDIIEIKIKNPYLRPNYDYIVDRMENEGCIVMTDNRLEAVVIGRNIKRRGYSYGLPEQGNGMWAVVLKKSSEDTKVNIDEHTERFKLLEAGKKVEVNNRGQILTLKRLYRRKFPQGKKKIMQKAESSGYTIWLE